MAERPLSRREIATLAGVDRDTVDARLGDLEVSLAARGIRLVASDDRVELVTAPEAGRLIAPLRRGRRDPAVAGGPRDAGDRRLPPAGHEGRRRADPRRRLRLHAARPPPPAADRGARAGRDPGPAVSSTGPASSSSSASGSPASTSCRRSTPRSRPASRRRQRCQRGPMRRPRLLDRRSRRARRGPGRGLMAPERLQKVLAAAGVASRREAERPDRRRPGHGRWTGGDARRIGRSRSGPHRRRRAAGR